MAEKEINITYETLFDLLRREKNRPELQKLSSSFIDDVRDYIKQKKSILKEQQIKIGMSADAEKENTENQIENIKSTLNKLLDRRQQKIVEMATIKAKTSSNPDDCQALLNEENKLFNSLFEVLSSFRKEILSEISIEEKTHENEEKKSEERQEESQKHENEEKSQEIEKQDPEKQQEKTKLIRFIHSVPRFVGRHLEVYGPFEEDDTANLPEEIADILVLKGRAEEIKK